MEGYTYNRYMKKKIQKNIYLKTYIIGVATSFLFLPLAAYAATTYSQDLFGIFEYAKDIIDDIVLWTFTTGAVLFFIYRIVVYIYQGADKSDKRKEQLKYIVYGLIALTLMFTFYAVAGLIGATFGISLGIPQFFGGQTGLTPGSGNVQRSYSVIGR